MTRQGAAVADPRKRYRRFMVSGFISERRPTSIRNAVRLHVGMRVRLESESAIDLYDAEFFTGRPEPHTVRIKHADVLHDDGERAVVRAQLLINESDPKWPQPLPVTYDLRKVAGTWKVDDIEWATGETSLKTHFLHPES